FLALAELDRVDCLRLHRLLLPLGFAATLAPAQSRGGPEEPVTPVSAACRDGAVAARAGSERAAVRLGDTAPVVDLCAPAVERGEQDRVRLGAARRGRSALPRRGHTVRGGAREDRIAVLHLGGGRGRRRRLGGLRGPG